MNKFNCEYNNNTILKQLLNVINGNVMRSIVNKYTSDFRVQGFDTNSHLYVMVYLQLSKSASLRETIIQLAHDISLDYRVYIHSVSQLSRKKFSRDYRVFEDLFYYLLKKVKSQIGIKNFNTQFKEIKAIDSTTIEIACKLAPQLYHQDKISGMKMSTLFNLSQATPDKIHIVKAKVNDRKCIDNFIDDTDILYLFDSGYYSYSWYDKLTDKGYKFITRQVSNASVEEVKGTYVNDPNVFDYEITLGTEYSKNKTKHTYREILTFDEGENEVRFITNIFDIDATQILELYRLRWKIESFFRWIKQNLNIKHWLGHNENEIKIPIYTALISYLLILIINTKLQDRCSIYEITRILKISITKRVNILTPFST